MKSLNSALQNYQLIKQIPDDRNFLIEGILRRRSVTLLRAPELIGEMVCQDCGSRQGQTCWDNGKKVWFCSNQACLDADSAITKQMAEKRRYSENLRRTKMAEQQKANKEWNGK